MFTALHIIGSSRNATRPDGTAVKLPQEKRQLPFKEMFGGIRIPTYDQVWFGVYTKVWGRVYNSIQRPAHPTRLLTPHIYLPTMHPMFYVHATSSAPEGLPGTVITTSRPDTRLKQAARC